MNRTLVIGIGNLLMKDDGVGVKVVGALRSVLREHGVASLLGETDVAFCLAEILPGDFLIIVDAMCSGKEPGTIQTKSFQDAQKVCAKRRTQHESSLFDAVALAYPQAKGCFITIEAAEIDFGLELSGSLQQRFETICAAVAREILNQTERG